MNYTDLYTLTMHNAMELEFMANKLQAQSSNSITEQT